MSLRPPGSTLRFTDVEKWKGSARQHGCTFRTDAPSRTIEAVLPDGFVLGDWDDHEGFGIINLEVLA